MIQTNRQTITLIQRFSIDSIHNEYYIPAAIVSQPLRLADIASSYYHVAG
jgi:hypothetical protein